MADLSKKIKARVSFMFFLKFFFLLITIFILDLIVGNIISKLYFRQESGELYRATYSIESTTAELLIFGSSTANHNYQPLSFTKRLAYSYYNVGRDGTSIFYDYAILQAILKRYQPKIIILNFDQGEFVKDEESYDRLSNLLPYYKNHSEMREIINLKSPYEKFKLLSKTYPFNSSVFTIAIGNTELNKKRRGDMKGYVPLTTIWDQPIQDGSTAKNYESDNKKIIFFQKFINECNDKGIKLFIVVSPFFIRPNYENNNISLAKKITNKYKINFIDFSKDTAFLNHPELFADIGHLNNNGANKFSNILLDSILNLPLTIPLELHK